MGIDTGLRNWHARRSGALTNVYPEFDLLLLSRLLFSSAAAVVSEDVAVETSTNAFKAFTKSNYRYNLQVLTGETGVGMDVHHIFPQASRFQQHWNRVGLNIHDPKNLTWWQSGAHRSAAGVYNKSWDAFFRQYPSATLQQIQNFGNSLMKSHGF